MAVHSESERRVKRIRALAIQLEEQTVLNTARSRSRCKEIAREILTLVAAEDSFEQTAPRQYAQDNDPDVLQRVTETLRACRTADDLPRLYSPMPSRGDLDLEERNR